MPELESVVDGPVVPVVEAVGASDGVVVGPVVPPGVVASDPGVVASSGTDTGGWVSGTRSTSNAGSTSSVNRSGSAKTRWRIRP